MTSRTVNIIIPFGLGRDDEWTHDGMIKKKKGKNGDMLIVMVTCDVKFVRAGR